MEVTPLKKKLHMTCLFQKISFSDVRQVRRWENRNEVFISRRFHHKFHSIIVVFLFIHAVVDDMFRVHIFWSTECGQVQKGSAGKNVLCFPKPFFFDFVKAAIFRLYTVNTTTFLVENTQRCYFSG